MDIRSDLDTLLRQCVQCGLCLPVCATYLATGDEALSPRGRLLLLGEALSDESSASSDRSVNAAWDLCLGCRACESACPSGVAFSLLEFTKERGVDPRTAAARRFSGLIASPRILSGLKTLSRATNGVLDKTVGEDWPQRSTGWPSLISTPLRMAAALPDAPDSAAELCRRLDALSGLLSDPADFPPRAAAGGDSAVRRVVILSGCANAGLLGATQRRLIRLLEAAGVEVTIPADQECCGAMAEHSHNPQAAARLAERNLRRLAPALADADALLVEAAGCGAHLQGYPETIAAKTRDATVYLDSLELPPLRRVPLKVAIHDPCHARHAQGIIDEPRRLLRRIPDLELVELPEPDVCCGAAGPYTLFHPVFSAEMGRRKAALIAGSGADLVVSTNPGCLGQIAAGLRLETTDLLILPLSDLLWYAMLQSEL